MAMTKRSSGGTAKRVERRFRLKRMRGAAGTLLRAEAGAALVEMAIASVGFFAVFFGLIFVGYALYVYDFISDATREACRYAIVRGSDCTGFAECSSTPPGATADDISTYVNNLNYPGINPSRMTVTTNWYTVVVKNGSTPTTYTHCGTTPTVTSGGVTTVCNQPGNSVRVQITYVLPFSIPFWRATTITMGSQSELTIAQ